MILKLVLNIGLILAIKTVSCNDDNLEIIQRLPNNTEPLHYDIYLKSHFEEDSFTFDGLTRVDIRIIRSSLNISLHSRKLEINEMATMLIADNGIIHTPKKHTHDNATNILTLHFKYELLPDLYTLNMKFVGNISENTNNGFIKFPYTNKKEKTLWLAVTHFEPNGARRVFPCWDEPAFKATFNISIKHHRDYGVLSNMPIEKESMTPDGIMWTRFHTTPLMSTYILAIVVYPASDYVFFSNHQKTINVWCRSSLMSQVTLAHDIATRVPQFLNQYTNTSIEKIPKIDHVLVPNFPLGGMENWGLITYNEGAIIYDDSRHPIYKKNATEFLMAHEIAHQWFGNLVTPSWWSHLWLSEGLASFFETYVYKDRLMVDYLVVRRLYYCYNKDIGSLKSVALEVNNTLDDGSLFAGEVYGKAPVLLRMLHNMISAEVFQKGLITYLHTYKYSIATQNDLWSAMQSALDKSSIRHKNYRIKEVMDTWMNQDRYPVVNVIRNYETGRVTISQTQVRKTNETITKPNKWWIPVTLATQSNPYFANTIPKSWLRPDQNMSLRINPNDWIIVNLQQSGYYRVNYDSKNWYKISNFLHGKKYMNIHPLNRAQIISDSFAFMMEGNVHISGYLYMNLLSYLAKETDKIVWYPMLENIRPLLKTLLLPEARYVKTHIAALLNRLLEFIKYTENRRDDDVTVLTRLLALKWACTLGDETCKATLAAKFSELLVNPNTHRILRRQKFMYCVGMMRADRITWNKMLDIYKRKDSKTDKFKRRFLKALSCVENLDTIIHYLSITANISLFDNYEHALAFSYILEKHAQNDLILDYVLKHFDNIKPRKVPVTDTMKKILWNVYSNEQIDKVKIFSEGKIYPDTNTSVIIQDLVEKRRISLMAAVNTFKKRFQTSHPPYDYIEPTN